MMSPTVCTALSAVAAVTLLLGCTSEGGAEEESSDSGPTCVEARQADGTGYRSDPAIAIAMSRGLELNHPEIGGIVDAVADYQGAHPDHESLQLDDTNDPAPETSVIYPLALSTLINRPELATPAVISAMEEVAAADGLAGVHSLIMDTDLYPADEYGGTVLTDLRLLVIEQMTAIRDSGIASLPTGDCQTDR